MLRRLLSLSVVLSFGCGSSGEDPDEGPAFPDLVRQDVPAPAEGTLQLASDRFSVAAGEEVFMCYRLAVAEEDLYIQRSRVYQVQGGHHSFVFYSPSGLESDPAVTPCDGSEMDNDIRFAAVGAGNGTGITMPDGVVTLVPAGAELWAQSHYINTGSAVAVAQDVVQLDLVEEAQVRDIAGSFAQVDFGFELAPRMDTARTMTCEIDREMNVPFVVPHMHEWGKDYSISIDRADGTRLWESSGGWSASLRNELALDPFEEPLVLHPGDTITTTCNWANTETSMLEFPKEMCVTFFGFYPSEGQLLICDEHGFIQGESSDISDLFQGENECTNAADRAILDDPVASEAVWACSIECVGGGACQCLLDAGLSEGCAACYGDNVACTFRKCLEHCADGDTPECSACNEAYCEDARNRCRGF